MLHLLDEGKDIAFGSTAETHVPARLVIDIERGCAF